MKQKSVDMTSEVEWEYDDIESINDLTMELRRQANWLEERKVEDGWELDSISIRTLTPTKRVLSGKFIVNHDLKTED